MANPYTIKIFVPDGDPEGVKIIEHMNWTGLGISFPRDKWPGTKQRTEFGKAGVYILVGYASEENDLPSQLSPASFRAWSELPLWCRTQNVLNASCAPSPLLNKGSAVDRECTRHFPLLSSFTLALNEPLSLFGCLNLLPF
jgi:hypothetical protein